MIDAQFFPQHRQIVERGLSHRFLLGLRAELIHCLDERWIAEVLSLPKIDGEWQSGGKFQQSSEPLYSFLVSRLLRKLRCFFFQARTHGIFKAADIEFDVDGRSLPKVALDAIRIKFGTLKGLPQVMIEDHL